MQRRALNHCNGPLKKLNKYTPLLLHTCTVHSDCCTEHWACIHFLCSSLLSSSNLYFTFFPHYSRLISIHLLLLLHSYLFCSSPYLRVFFLDNWVVAHPILVCAALQRRTEAGRSRASCAANTAHAWMATGGTEGVREGEGVREKERERRREGGYNSRRTGANQQLLQRLVVLATDHRCLPLPLTGSSPAKWMMSAAEACVPAFCAECSLKKEPLYFFRFCLSLSIRSLFLPRPSLLSSIMDMEPD